MILVCGEALFDLFLDRENGRSLAFDARPGGSPFNVAVGLARLRQPTAFLAGLSTDLLGERLARMLAEEGVETGLLRRRPRPTTLSIVGVGIDGGPAYAFYGEGTADRDLLLSDLEPLPDTISALSVGSFATVVAPIGDTLDALVRRESPRRLVAYDPNVRRSIEPDLDIWRRKVAGLVPSVHLMKISTEDFEILFPGADPAGLARHWLAAGVRLVVLTRGAEGVAAWTREVAVTVPATKVAVVDTVGAGDTFQAALLTALSETGQLSPAGLDALAASSLRAVLGFAGAAAAITCSRRGADLPRRDELPAVTAG